MDMTKLRTPLCIAAGVCFAVYLVFGAMNIATLVSNAASTVSPLQPVLGILARNIGIVGAALAAISLFMGKRAMLGAGALVMGVSSIVTFISNLISFIMISSAGIEITPLILLYPILGAAALIVLAVASFSGSSSRVAPIVACVIWAVKWVMPLSMASTIIIPWVDVAVTVAMILIIVAWPLPGKAQAAVAGRPATAMAATPVKAAAPAMTAAEMEQYGKLYEAGALTKEEFDAIRRRYLGL